MVPEPARRRQSPDYTRRRWGYDRGRHGSKRRPRRPPWRSCWSVVVPAAHAGYGDIRDPRGDVSYGGGSFGPDTRADRPDLDILSVDLDRNLARRLRWTVRFAAPPPRQRNRVNLTISFGRHSFRASGRRLQRVTLKGGRCCEISHRRVRFQRIGKRRLRWSIRRKHLFLPRKLTYRVVSNDPYDTRDVGDEDREANMSAMDFAPDLMRGDERYDVRPPRKRGVP